MNSRQSYQRYQSHQSGLPPQQPPPYSSYSPTPEEEKKQRRRTLRRTANGIGLGFLALAGTQYVLSYLLSYIVGVMMVTHPDLAGKILTPRIVDGVQQFYYTNEFYTIVSLTLYIAGFVVAILVSRAVIGIPAKVAFPLRRPPMDVTLASVPISLASILIGSYLTQMLSQLLNQIFGYLPQAPDFNRPEGLGYNILYFISIAVAPAFLEEFLCRGVVLQSLREFGDNFALIISSILFGLMHGNLVQTPYSLVVGLVMGYFVLYTGSLWPAILAHFINNGMAVVQEWLTVSTTAAQDMQIYYTINSLYLLLGIAGLLYLRISKGSLFYVKRQKGPLKESEKYVTFFTAVVMIFYVLYELYNILNNLIPAM